MQPPWQGKLVGRYEIVAEIGRGAMGVVYKARDPKIDRFVALKTISLVGQSADEVREYRNRFFQEAQAAGRLLHPGIVTIFDVGEEPETHDPYIVMEYVTGRSLDQILSAENGKLPILTALSLTEELAEALDYAHAQGVVHRDIKPANIIVTDEGHAKIADFGIAKLNLSGLTLPGRALGTPAYMSPEQLEGESVDGRSDLFSVGVVLYSMITGYRPFQGNSVTTVCFKIANRDPLQATTLNPELPPEVDAVISRAIAKDRTQRYQRGMELAKDVRDLLERLCPKSGSDAVHQSSSGQIKVSQGSRSAFSVAGFNVEQIFSRKLLAISASIVIVAPLVWWRSVSSSQGLFQDASAREEIAAPLPQISNAGVVPQAQIITKASADPNLEIQVTHQFRDATLRMWIDGNLAYSRPLRAQSKSRLAIFRKLRGYDTGKATIPDGRHRVAVRVQSKADSYDGKKTISGDFAQGNRRILQITFEGRDKNMQILLK